MRYLITLVFLFIGSQVLAQDTEVDIKKSVEKGAVIYADFCMNCHLASGEGVPSVFPPLAKSDYLLKNRTESIKAVKFGMKGEITVNGETYNSVMALPGLTDDEIADVMNYVLSNWGNKLETPVSKEEVLKISE